MQRKQLKMFVVYISRLDKRSFWILLDPHPAGLDLVFLEPQNFMSLVLNEHDLHADSSQW